IVMTSMAHAAIRITHFASRMILERLPDVDVNLERALEFAADDVAIGLEPHIDAYRPEHGVVANAETERSPEAREVNGAGLRKEVAGVDESGDDEITAQQ